MLTPERARQIIDRALAASKADETFVSLSDGETHHLRYARNAPSHSGVAGDRSLTVTTSFGARSGSATTNQLDDASIAAVVERAEALARLAPEDPEHVPVLGAQSYADVRAFHDSVVERGPELMAQGAATCIRAARERDLVAAGYVEASARASAIGSSAGLFGYHRRTDAYFSQTVRTADAAGSGWASDGGNRLEEIDFAAASEVAIDKAVRSRQPRPLAPGKYVTILEPACVANLVSTLAWSLDARSADEGRSFFAKEGGGNRLGEALFPPSVTLYSDPVDPLAPGSPWGEDGLPQARRVWIDRGKLADLTRSRFWAGKQGVAPVPRPSNLIMSGGSGTVQDLIASTERGVLITSFWYIRSVDPRTMLHTGLTRDGVFWIENGEIAYPLTNFRWNESPVRVLKNVEAMSATVRASGRESSSTTIAVPALRVREFELTSVSEAV